MTAAVQANRMSKSVVMVGPECHLGGLSAGGLGFTDSGNKAVIGGLLLGLMGISSGTYLGFKLQGK
ncbi:MAG: FAD-dependent oxidoreductase [Bryobacteraceae bacterium]